MSPPNKRRTRWTVSVSKSTDIAVRGFLARRGMKKGDLSRFVVEAVQWRVLDRTIADARSRFKDMAPDALDALIGEAVAADRLSGGIPRDEGA